MTIGKFIQVKLFRVINRISSLTDFSHCVILSFNDISSFNNIVILRPFNGIVIGSFDDILSFPQIRLYLYILSFPVIRLYLCHFTTIRHSTKLSFRHSTTFRHFPSQYASFIPFLSVGVFCSDISYSLFFSKGQKRRIEWD